MYLVTFVDDSAYYPTVYVLGIYDTEDLANIAIENEKKKYSKNRVKIEFNITHLITNETNEIKYNDSLSCYKSDIKLR